MGCCFDTNIFSLSTLSALSLSHTLSLSLSLSLLSYTQLFLDVCEEDRYTTKSLATLDKKLDKVRNRAGVKNELCFHLECTTNTLFV